MGNYKFRFSDIMPNAWFHKLKDMSKPRTLNHTKKKRSPPSSSGLSDQRKSYYYTRDLTSRQDSPTKTTTPSDRNPITELPRKSSQRRRRSTNRNRRPLVSSSVSGGCSCRKPEDSPPSPEECTNSGPDRSSLSSEPDSVLTEYGSDRDTGRSPDFWSSPCKCGNDIVLDIDNDDDHRRLPPIITKKSETTKIHRTSAEFSETNAYSSMSVKVAKDDFVVAAAAPVRRLSVKASSPGVKLRVNSPRIVNRRIQGRKSNSRRSISDSFAVVKASKDPRRDFKESMVEMIVENNIRASKDLEELLACYLSLNSDEYHDLIINVFKQIWFDFVHLRLK